MEEKQFQDLMQKLDAVIQLQAATLTKDKNTRDSIKVLDGAGLKATMIASLLGKKPKFIYKEIGIIKKKK